MPDYIETESTPLNCLQYLMDENKINVKQLSKILGVDQSHAGKIACGRRGITDQNAVKLAKRFCVKPELFMTPKKEVAKQVDKPSKCVLACRQVASGFPTAGEDGQAVQAVDGVAAEGVNQELQTMLDRILIYHSRVRLGLLTASHQSLLADASELQGIARRLYNRIEQQERERESHL